MPIVAGAGVLAVVIFAGISGHGGTTSADPVQTTAAGAVTTSAVITAAPIVVNTDPAIVKTNLTHSVAKGNAGDDVKAGAAASDRPRLRTRARSTGSSAPGPNRRSGPTRSWS